VRIPGAGGSLKSRQTGLASVELGILGLVRGAQICAQVRLVLIVEYHLASVAAGQRPFGPKPAILRGMLALGRIFL